MVGVAQWLEHWVVVPAVAGSTPVTHPKKNLPTDDWEDFIFLFIIYLSFQRLGEFPEVQQRL